MKSEHSPCPYSWLNQGPSPPYFAICTIQEILMTFQVILRAAPEYIYNNMFKYCGTVLKTSEHRQTYTI